MRSSSCFSWCLRDSQLTISLRSSLTSLRTSIAVVDATSAALRDLHPQIDSRLLELARTRNTLIPINSLPPETVSQILLQAIPEEAEDMTWHRKLAKVQRHWRDIIRSNPSFWTVLRSNMSSEEIEFKLRKSGNVPLSLGMEAPGRREVARFMELVSPHGLRWSTFSFHWGRRPAFDIVRPLLRVPYPRLHSLSLGLASGEETVDFSDFGGAPNLAELRLCRVMIPLSSLSDLRSLILQDLSATMVTTDALHQLLTTSPRLETLQLANIDTSEPTLSRPHRESLHFPCLVSMYLATIPATFVRMLLPCVTTTNRNLTLTAICPESQGVETFHQLIRRPNESRPSILTSLLSNPKISSISVEVSSSWLSIEAHLDSGSRNLSRINLKGQLLGKELEKNLGDLPFYNTSVPVDFHLRYDTQYIDIQAGESCALRLQALPILTSITLTCDAPQAMDLLQCLSARNSDGSWLCPKLSAIDFPSSFRKALSDEEWLLFMNALSNLVEVRQGGEDLGTTVRRFFFIEPQERRLTLPSGAHRL